MNSYHKEATVGLLVLVAIVAFVLGTMWLRGQSWGNPPTIRVAYEDIGNLKSGSPVLISGAVVGRVEELRFERMGRVIVVATYDDDLVTPTVNSTATIRGVGMLGDMVIDLDPGSGAPLGDDTIIEGTMSPGLAELGTALAANANTALTSLNAMLDTALVQDLRSTLQSTQRVMMYLADSRNGPTAEVNNTMRQLQSVSARFDSALQGVDTRALAARFDSTLRSADDLSVKLAGMTVRMDSLLAGINAGRGSLGKLASDSSLYVELQKTLGATRALVDSLANHPEKLGITVRIF